MENLLRLDNWELQYSLNWDQILESNWIWEGKEINKGKRRKREKRKGDFVIQ